MSHPQNERIQDNLIDLIAEREWELEWKNYPAKYPDDYDIERDRQITLQINRRRQ